LLHVGMGTIFLSWPWLFHGPVPVAILAVSFAGLIFARRVCPSLDAHVAGVIYGVGRTSYGELWFPVSACLLFTLSRGDWLLFCAPVALLAYADAAAAILGTRYGRARLRGGKSVEGCLACCAVAFVTTHVLLSLDGRAAPVKAVLVAVEVAILTMVLEAASPAGLDNLTVPLAGWGLLRTLPQTSTALLLGWLAVSVAVSVALLFKYGVTSFGRSGWAAYSLDPARAVGRPSCRGNGTRSRYEQGRTR